MDETAETASGGKQTKLIAPAAAIGAALILLTAISFVLGDRPSQYGKLMQFNGGQLFYTSNVTKDEANKLGDFLVKEGFFDGDPKTVQINKHGERYEFRMVVKEGVETNPIFISVFQLMTFQLSTLVFGSSPVEIHLCDKNLETIKVVELNPILTRSLEFASNKAPEFSLQDTNGETIKLSDFKGKIVVLNFWATWAPACMKEMRNLEKLYKAHKDNLIVIGISVDTDNNNTDAVKNYLRDRNITYPIVMATQEMLNKYKLATGKPIETIPTTIFVDRKSAIGSEHPGLQSEISLEQAYEKSIR